MLHVPAFNFQTKMRPFVKIRFIHYGYKRIYQAPECVKGDIPADPSWDVYAIGMVLYHVMAGSLPYVYPTKDQYLTLDLPVQKEENAKTIAIGKAEPILLYEKLKGSYEEMSAGLINPKVFTKLFSVVDRSIQKDPSVRYQTAEQFREELVYLSVETAEA